MVPEEGCAGVVEEMVVMAEGLAGAKVEDGMEATHTSLQDTSLNHAQSSSIPSLHICTGIQDGAAHPDRSDREPIFHQFQ